MRWDESSNTIAHQLLRAAAAAAAVQRAGGRPELRNTRSAVSQQIRHFGTDGDGWY